MCSISQRTVEAQLSRGSSTKNAIARRDEACTCQAYRVKPCIHQQTFQWACQYFSRNHGQACQLHYVEAEPTGQNGYSKIAHSNEFDPEAISIGFRFEHEDGSERASAGMSLSG
jgi:hypothetical protein